jgi:hypothetical protein
MSRSRAYLVVASLSLLTAATILTSTTTSNAEAAGPYYSNTIHQSAGGHDSRGFPKYYRHSNTPGAYASESTNGHGVGPHYSSTIHQSVGGRDSRGFPKYYQGSQFGGAYAGAYSLTPQRDFQLQGRGLGG